MEEGEDAEKAIKFKEIQMEMKRVKSQDKPQRQGGRIQGEVVRGLREPRDDTGG